MAHIDTLEKYDDLVKSGVPQNQARAHVKSLDKCFDTLVTQQNLDASLKLQSAELKYFFTWEIVAVCFVFLTLPIVSERFFSMFKRGK